MGPGFESPTSHHVGAKSAPLRFKAVPFGAALKLRSAPLLLLPQLEPAALGFELVWVPHRLAALHPGGGWLLFGKNCVMLTAGKNHLSALPVTAGGWPLDRGQLLAP